MPDGSGTFDGVHTTQLPEQRSVATTNTKSTLVLVIPYLDLDLVH